MSNAWFFEKFELIADLPDAVSRMRELVLKLAMLGRLVEHHSKEGHARELLQKIIETTRRTTDRKVRPSRTDIDIDVSSLPPIPDHWVWTTLGTIGSWGSGSTPPRGDNQLYGGKITWLKSGELNDNKALCGSEERVTDKAIEKCSFRRNLKGDVLFAMYGATVGKVAVLAEPAVTNQAVCGCTPCVGILNFFLFYYLISERKNFRDASEGGAQPNFSKDKILVFPIPLPPLSEQRRIVAKVEELMGICDRLELVQRERESSQRVLVRSSLQRFSEEASVENLGYLFHRSYTVSPSDLRKTILTLAVQGKLVPQDPADEPASQLVHQITSEKSYLIKNKVIRASSAHTKRDDDRTDGELPQGWIWTQIDEITSVGTGSTPLKSQRDFYEKGDVPWVTSAATNNEFIQLPEQFVTRKAVKECNLRVYPKGSLLIALYGQGKTRGQVGQLMFDSTTNQACAVLEFFESGESVRDYIRLFFLKKYDELREQAAGGAQPNLSGGMIRLTRVPLPPLAEQRRIVAKVEELMSMVDELEEMEKQATDRGSSLLDAIVHELAATAG